jgi:hypothetical protein
MRQPSDPEVEAAEREVDDTPPVEVPKAAKQQTRKPALHQTREEKDEEVKTEIAKKEKVIILFPNGVPGHLQARGYAIYTEAKHGPDYIAKAEEMRNRFLGIEVKEVLPVDKGTEVVL